MAVNKKLKSFYMVFWENLGTFVTNAISKTLENRILIKYKN